MTKTLITLGDSWPQGGELKPEDLRYGEIIRNAMEFDEFYNYGSAGASNEDLVYQFQDYFNKHYRPDSDVTAIFFLTNPARTAHFPRFTSWNINKFWHPDARDQIKELYLHFHDRQHEIMRNSVAITALQKWCDIFRIRDYYFSGWVRYESWLPGVDLDRIWRQGQETAADWFGASRHNGEHLLDVGENIYIKPNFAHPNQLGHQLIADNLMAWISEKTKY